ncbi:Fungal Zn(2)-Cys(6) binuclear cluster domain-containing protein [Penicillium ucsense]|uniref:Fungal Zn(2)-Cys(6) binuclear cluster domain-containing protein n=1 Tax=Penicillium ucsense TaxID=2839758 RepID=A0A8J8WH23_9EURO|nr:Fungal Zn(2)-Cys(6) binuclear cluster domain-containing protein [Penicillium ucsense]KAF7734262.1 Fungal Zn(2)-Cys(6) binuclear cluster domain-containing protein [Penicillium ucsense]
MLNVRIASLPADRQTAARDCRRCIKRRIKCDRTLPRCRKCTIREYQCPGYDAVQLKWGSGDKRVRKSSVAEPLSEELNSTLEVSNSVQNDDASRLRAIPPSSSSSTPSSSSSLSGWETISSEVEVRQMQSSISTATRPPPINDRSLVDRFTSQSISRNLFTHFNINVCPRLTWVDQLDHPWRKVIAPLAQRSKSLGLSILSVAAAHLSFTSTNSVPTPDLNRIAISNRLRDQSLHQLNQKINLELIQEHSMIDSSILDSTLIEILATTLVLCYGEMLIPNSTDWNLHLHACRVLIERYLWRNNQSDSQRNPVVDFIIREVADIEVYRSIGAFSADQTYLAEVLRPQSIMLEGSLHTFTDLFREITVEERRRHAAFSNFQQEQQALTLSRSLATFSSSDLPSPPDMASWRAKIELAYARASTDTARIVTAQGATTQKWMAAIVRAVYHATLIYAYQTLASSAEVAAEVDASMPSLWAELELLTTGPTHSFSHDIFVPLFIAGTESWGDEARQELVESRFQELMTKMGIWCNFTVLKFLKGFWVTKEYHRVGGWVPYARITEAENGPFFVF